ncbi:hypothetical protein HaLaN_11143 [Haematococcus lacustris]|uniref:Uncharacterized protein n=1 Tax=Haematococcus lacustris TaxID=44745 RepID=A0A699Z0G9_HAELA|nr:hypothetical protein HaLaN_11143 [Haematococcus lacustris]
MDVLNIGSQPLFCPPLLTCLPSPSPPLTAFPCQLIPLLAILPRTAYSGRGWGSKPPWPLPLAICAPALQVAPLLSLWAQEQQQVQVSGPSSLPGELPHTLTAPRLDAWYGWLPLPPSSPSQPLPLAYLANPCLPTLDDSLVGRCLEAGRKLAGLPLFDPDCLQPTMGRQSQAARRPPRDGLPALWPHCCVVLACWAAGKWVLSPHAPALCQPEAMVGSVQRAGGLGLVLYAARSHCQVTSHHITPSFGGHTGAAGRPVCSAGRPQWRSGMEASCMGLCIGQMSGHPLNRAQAHTVAQWHGPQRHVPGPQPQDHCSRANRPRRPGSLGCCTSRISSKSASQARHPPPPTTGFGKCNGAILPQPDPRPNLDVC